MRRSPLPSPAAGLLSTLRIIPPALGAAALLAGVSALRAAPGDIDPSFRISIQGLQGDECRIIPAGDQFYIYNRWGSRNWWSDIPSDYLTRWNADGTRDTTFKASPIDGEVPVFGPSNSPNPSAPKPWSGGIRNTVREVHVQEDGTLLVTGYFGWRDDSSEKNGSGAFSFPVDHSGGGLPSVPASADNQGEARQCLPLGSGGFMLVGDFKARPSAGSIGDKMIRLKPDFSVDQEFAPPGFDWGINLGTVFSELSDGGFLCWMSFITSSPPVNGEFLYMSRVRRLHADGSRDTSFTNPAEFRCSGMFRHPDGMMLLTDYDVPGSVDIPLVRLRGDGTPDPNFKTPADFRSVGGLMLQVDGKMLAGGSLRKIQDGGLVSYNTVELFRMNADGSLDSTFPLIEHPDNLQRLMLMADGQVILEKTSDGFPTGTFVRIKNDPAVSVLEKVETTTLRWRRGGSAPEVWRVTFEHRAAGAGGWTPLGNGRRVSGGWELTAPGGLPAEGQIRARGWNPGHPNNSGWVEATMSLGVPLDAWRLSHFGSVENVGDGADGADPDGDGLPNLTEYLFDSSPKAPSASALPAWTVSGDHLECRFNTAAGLTPLGIVAEWASDPASPSWQAVEGQAEGTQQSFRIPLSGRQRIFVRLRISVPQG